MILSGTLFMRNFDEFKILKQSDFVYAEMEDTSEYQFYNQSSNLALTWILTL
jgi:hypothetical protein